MAQDPRIGERLGPFVLERNLDPHGQGSVYHAIHVEQRRAVAVRVLEGEDVCSTSKLMEQFTSELQFLKTLEHPHVVPCYGGGISDGRGYIAGELIRGGSLAEQLAREGPQPWIDLVPSVQQVCAALEYAAHRGTLHLALATDKLLLTETGTIRVAGFRRRQADAASIEDDLLAERSEEDTERQRARLRYAAPEQICGKPAATTRTDLYALGCILFELLTGRPPFDGATPEELKQQHLTEQPPRVSTLLLDCPLWLDTLLGQMLEKSPERRPQYPSDVATALDETRERVTAGTGAAAHAMTRQPTAVRAGRGAAADRHLLARKQKPKPRTQRPLHERPWFLGLCLAAVAAFVVWAAWPPGEKALLAKAEALMQTGNRTDMNHAKEWYLEPLLERFPDGACAPKAREYIDRTDMANAEARLKVQAVLGRPPKTPGARLYVEAFKYEQFGDYATARAKYAALIDRHAKDDDRPYALLARRRLAGIADTADAPRGAAEFVAQKLAEADALRAAGKLAEARAIWEQLLVMYADREPLADQLGRARQRLSGQSPSVVQPTPQQE